MKLAYAIQIYKSMFPITNDVKKTKKILHRLTLKFSVTLRSTGKNF